MYIKESMGYENMHKVENEPIFEEFCEERGISSLQ